MHAREDDMKRESASEHEHEKRDSPHHADIAQKGGFNCGSGADVRIITYD